jgi:EmrB/QacA subfamily drug resistance transporter
MSISSRSATVPSPATSTAPPAATEPIDSAATAVLPLQPSTSIPPPSQGRAGDGGSASAPAGGAAAAAPRKPVDRAVFLQLFSAVMLPMFLAAIDQTLLATATPIIGRQFGALDQTSWLAVSYLLASVVMVPMYGQLGDQYGRRKLLRLAIMAFALGSLGCGLAPSFGFLIAARVLQGLGGGGLMTLSQALIGEVLPPRERARYQGYFAIVFTLASVGGPVIGGLVVHHASWRWLFLVNLPLCLFAIWRLQGLRGQDQMHPHRGRRDVLGGALFAAAMIASLTWLTSAGHRFDWLSATSVVLFVVAAAAWTLLVRRELRQESPFLPVDLLRAPEIRFAVLTVIAFASTMFAMVFYLPVYLQLSLGTNPAESGLLLLPLTAGIVFGAATTGRLIVWTGRPTMIPKFGLSFASLCLIGLAFAPPDKRILIGLGFGTGLGLGSVMSVMQIVTQMAAGPARLGAAAATMSLSRSLGSAVGASAFGALIFGLIDSHDLAAAVSTPAMRAQVHTAFQYAFVAAAVLCAFAAYMSSRVPAVRFDKDGKASESAAEPAME